MNFFGLNLSAWIAAWSTVAGLLAVPAYAAGPLFSTSTYSTVSGTASFEKHNTLTPQYCTQEGCVKPKPYWALVLSTGGGRYELDQLFALGSSQAPASITLGTVVITPGARVSIVAHVDVESRSYSILSDVQDVKLEGDAKSQIEPEGAPFFGWSCRSVSERLPIYVDVEQVSRGGVYAMKVQGESRINENSLHTIVSFDNVALAMTPASIDFAGISQSVRAQLSIDQSSGRFNALDSQLRLSGSVRQFVRLVCDRTR